MAVYDLKAPQRQIVKGKHYEGHHEKCLGLSLSPAFIFLLIGLGLTMIIVPTISLADLRQAGDLLSKLIN